MGSVFSVGLIKQWICILNYVSEQFFLTKPKFAAYILHYCSWYLKSSAHNMHVFSIGSMFLLLEVTIASELLPDEYL